MSNTYFKFKQFKINQDRCAMKVGTDGVLLGAWASMGAGDGVGAAAATWSPGPLRQAAQDLPPLHFLDIGTGTGLLALMLAQRAASREWGGRAFFVTAVEREASAAAQARENVSASPWAALITVVTADIRTWQPAAETAGSAASDPAAETAGSAASDPAAETAGSAAPVPAAETAGSAASVPAAAPRFDLIVCNPPYFADSLKCPDAARNAARHDDNLKPDDLFRLAAAWLKPAPAAFNLILPADREASAIAVAARYGLFPARRCRVYTAPRSVSPGRVLLAFVRSVEAATACSPVSQSSVETLRLYTPTDSTEPGGSTVGQASCPPLTPATSTSAPMASACPQYTAEYRALVQPFYL